MTNWPALARALAAAGCDLTDYGAALAAADFVTCDLCTSQFNAAHFASCPFCALSHDGDSWDDKSTAAQTTREQLRRAQ